MRILIFFFFLLQSLQVFASFQEAYRRIQAHIVIGDLSMAASDAHNLVVNFPDNALAHEIKIKALSLIGDEEGCLNAWETLIKQFPEKKEDFAILEDIALGIMRKGCVADALNTRLIGYLAMAKSQLPEAVEFIKKGLSDSNAALRTLNVEVAAVYSDEPLKEELRRLFRAEKNVEVRLALLKAIAKLKMIDLLPEIVEKLEKSSKLSAAEKKEATLTLAELRDNITHFELKELINNGRIWEQELACYLIKKKNCLDEADLLSSLIQKGTKDTKLTAMQTQFLMKKVDREVIFPFCYDKDPHIGIMASTLLFSIDKERGRMAFTHWLKAKDSKIRALAVNALLITAGKKGVDLVKELVTDEDLFVRANMAFQFLKLRVDVKENAAFLYNFLHTKEQLMWNDEGPFPYISKSSHVHKSLIPNFPEAINQTTRLEILNMLAIVEYEKTELAIAEFLKNTPCEVTSLAAELLLQEGDVAAISLVKSLLKEEDKEIATGAALLLAVWGRDKQAIAKLLELYEENEKLHKIKILEALGHVGDRSLIPFLVERLKEPSATMRLVAACILLEVLYH